MNKPKIDIPNTDLKIPKVKSIKEEKINIPNVIGDLNIPKIDNNLDIKTPKINLSNIDINLSNIDIEGKIDGDMKIPKVDIPEISPLNIRTILIGKVNDPIILNKHNLLIPDIKVGVKIPKGKDKLDINIPKIKGPKLDIPDINIPKIETDINIQNLDIKTPKMEISNSDVNIPNILLKWKYLIQM